MAVTQTTVDPKQLLPTFGLAQFRDGQLAVIKRLLEGKSAAAIFPTGGGKSLCYQLPSQVFEGLTLVVSPLMALMKDQVEQLTSRGILAARLDSSQTADEARQVTEQVRAGKIRLLYVAPERFFNELFREFIRTVKISMFAIDEAHCISQWGHSFRPDYLKLARIAKELQADRVLALTATATPAVLDDICTGFDIARSCAIQTPFYRDNLRLQFTRCSAAEREKLLVQRLSQSDFQGPAIVYVTQQRTAEEVAERLVQAGLNARAYHAGLDDTLRSETQDWFMQGNQGIVVATIAFGMGVDKSNIRAIYHYNPAKSIENYAQEIGRAGRDGQPALCETLLVANDRIPLENYAYGDTPSRSAIRFFVNYIKNQPERFFVSNYSLGYDADMRDTVVRSLLTYLELEDILIATSSRYESYQFKPRISSTEILSHFKGERREFAFSVLALSLKKKVWFSIDLPQAANRLKCDRTRIVKMLDYFAEKGWVELQVSGLVHGYRKLKAIDDPDALVQQLFQYLLEREIGELSRLEELFQMMCSDRCASAALTEHFGQSMHDGCGHCSICDGNILGPLSNAMDVKVGTSAMTGLRALCKEQPEALGEARQQARFLCGINSPKLTRKRLTKHPLFGCCSGVPFDQVLDELSSIG